MSHSATLVRRSTSVTLDRKTFLSDPALLSALGAHVRSRVPGADADDVVQSVLADALSATTAPDDDEETMRRWLFGVARHKIADFYRRTRREPPTDAADERGAPSSGGKADAKDLLRWAEEELPPGSDAKRTFEWMLREGDGEKLESIAESEKLPAPRVRKRVSRMREHFRARWAAYVAAIAVVGVIVALYIYRKSPTPEARIVPEPSASDDPLELSPRERDAVIAKLKGRRERQTAFEACDRAEWQPCIDGLDHAAQVDPAGDTDPRVVSARDKAHKALAPQPLPTSSAPQIPTPTPTTIRTTPPTTTATPTSIAPMPSGRSSTPSSGTGGSSL